MNSSDVRPWSSLNWPNRISLLRLLLVGPFVLLIMYQRNWPAARYIALAIFLLMAFSDFVDGLIARRLNARTRLGLILDPLADKVLIICAVVLLSLPGTAVPGAKLKDWVVVAIVGKDLWVIVGFLVIYLVTDRFRIRATLAGKTCTVAQLVMVGFVLIAPDVNGLGAQAGSWIAYGLGWAVAALSVTAILSYTRLGLSFVAREEKPMENTSPEAR